MEHRRYEAIHEQGIGAARPYPFEGRLDMRISPVCSRPATRKACLQMAACGAQSVDISLIRCESATADEETELKECHRATVFVASIYHSWSPAAISLVGGKLAGRPQRAP